MTNLQVIKIKYFLTYLEGSSHLGKTNLGKNQDTWSSICIYQYCNQWYL